MCVVSLVMDHFGDKWDRLLPPATPWVPPVPLPNPVNPPPVYPQPTGPSPITPEEIDEFRQLLERAREYDRRNNEPDCELESKRERLRKLAKELGVDISFIERREPSTHKPDARQVLVDSIVKDIQES